MNQPRYIRFTQTANGWKAVDAQTGEDVEGFRVEEISSAQAEIEKHHQHIAMMTQGAETIVSFKDPDTAINGEYRVMRDVDGVYHIVHLEDGLYTSHFIIGRDALFDMTMRLTGHFCNNA